MSKIEKGRNIFGKIATLIEQARKKVAAAINQEMVILYWDIGKTIKEEIIKSNRAGYGKQILQSLSEELIQRYGKGFSTQNLWHMTKFYEIFPILSAVRREFKGLSAEKDKEIIELLFLKNDRIKVAEYLTKLPSKKLFAEKLHKAIQVAQIQLKK